MEDINSWVATLAAWLTLLECGYKVLKRLLPKIRESFKQWRATRKR